MEKKKFEELLKELEEVVASLESGKLSLDESVLYYKRGMELSLECQKRLEEAKQVIVKKVEQGKEVDFN